MIGVDPGVHDGHRGANGRPRVVLSAPRELDDHGDAHDVLRSEPLLAVEIADQAAHGALVRAVEVRLVPVTTSQTLDRPDAPDPVRAWSRRGHARIMLDAVAG